MSDITPSSPISSEARAGHRGHSRNHSGRHQIADGGGFGQGRGSRGGSRGSRGRTRWPGHTMHNESQPTIRTNPEAHLERPPGGLVVPAKETSQVQNESSREQAVAQKEEAVADDGEVCFICASPIEHVSIAPCNHQTCHICSLRMRALYKTRACAHCRTESAFVVFTDEAEKRFQDFQDKDFAKIDENLGIKYEKDEILEDTILLLRYNCPDKDCDVACLGWPDLHRHVRSKHGKIMCDLCTRNKKVFTHEHELFTFGELRRHEKFGDDKPGAEDQSGFKGHPECGFCKQRFYGDDELYSHCREKHERCHICDRRNAGASPQYYLNYTELEKHFADAHFVCLDAECQANKTNVFESEIDLQAHQLSEHPNGISKGREARLINLSGFDLRTPYQPTRRGGRDRGDRGDREGRGNGRGRDPNAEPLPQSSAQPMSRAELAYQRQMAIQNASSGPVRTFGGALTQQQASVARPQSQAPQQSTTSNPVPSLDTLSLESTPNSANLTPQDQARALRHQSVITRATTLSQNNSTKLSQFRTHVSAYRSGTTSATDLIDAFFGLFDCPSSELGKLIRELADLYEDEPKRVALLEAWNSWRSINEDYPSLPGPSGTLPGTSAGLPNVTTGRRILKLKSSTAQSSRSTVSRQGSWGNSLPPVQTRQTPSATASRDAFPALSTTLNSTRNTNNASSLWGPSVHTGTGTVTTTTSTSATRIANQGNNRTNIISSKPPTTMSRRQNEDMFPSLPSAPKPNVMMAGFNTRGTAKWGNSGTSTPSAWGTGASTPQSGPDGLSGEFPGLGSMTAVEGDGGVGGGAKKKKGKGKKGETLFHFG